MGPGLKPPQNEWMNETGGRLPEIQCSLPRGRQVGKGMKGFWALGCSSRSKEGLMGPRIAALGKPGKAHLTHPAATQLEGGAHASLCGRACAAPRSCAGVLGLEPCGAMLCRYVRHAWEARYYCQAPTSHRTPHYKQGKKRNEGPRVRQARGGGAFWPEVGTADPAHYEFRNYLGLGSPGWCNQ